MFMSFMLMRLFQDTIKAQHGLSDIVAKSFISFMFMRLFQDPDINTAPKTKLAIKSS